MGKDYRDEINKACKHMNEILDKPAQTAQEVDAAHHYAEIIYYLTTAGAMNKAEDGSYIDGQSMARGGRTGRARYSEGSYEGQMRKPLYEENMGYSERRGGGSMNRIPHEVYGWENDEYSERQRY